MNDVIESGYIRVSEILGRLRDRSNIHPNVLQEKGQIGDEVHNNIYLDANGGFPHYKKWPVRHALDGNILFSQDGTERWEERGLGYFRSYCMWEKEKKPKYELMEKRFNDPEMMITGRIDALLSSVGSPILLDFKCSYNPDHEIWKMQAHFYWYLLKQNGFEILPRFIFLQLKPLKDGKTQRPVEHWYDFDQQVLERCMFEAEKCWEEKKAAQILD